MTELAADRTMWSSGAQICLLAEISVPIRQGVVLSAKAASSTKSAQYPRSTGVHVHLHLRAIFTIPRLSASRLGHRDDLHGSIQNCTTDFLFAVPCSANSYVAAFSSA
ncbi:unnamed protein product, partial [Sphacelaria rigidula]